MQGAGDPGSDGAADDRGQTERAEDRPVVLALEQLRRNRAENRCEPVAEHALRRYHQIEERGRRMLAHGQQQPVGAHEADARQRPHPFASDPVGEVAERDLADDAGEADEPERAGRHRGREADLHQIFRLVHLHGVPGDERAEVAEHDPPEAAGT